MVVEKKNYYLTGECIETSLENICEALQAGDWSVDLSDELELSGDDWNLEVYEVASGGTFSLGGASSAQLESVTTVLEAIAKRLSDHGIVSTIQASLDGEPGYVLKIVHPDYPDF